MAKTQIIDQLIFTSEAYKEHIKFWTRYKGQDSDGFTFRQIDYSLPTNNKETVDFTMNKECVDILEGKSQGSDTALFVCMLSIWGRVLQRYSNKEHVMVHSPLLSLNGNDNLVSDYVPLFLDLNPEHSLLEVLTTTQDTVKKSYMYQNYPLNLLKDQVPGNIFKSNVLISFSSIHEIMVADYDYDLVIAIDKENSGNIKVHISYSYNAFEGDFIEHIKSHFQEAIIALNDLDTKVKSVNILPKFELDFIKEKIERAATDTSYRQCIPEVFERQAIQNGDAVALSMGNHSMSYQELNEKVNQLAHYLRDHNKIGPGDVVGLMMQRSELMIIGILGIIKAGGAYLPIDLAHPEERKLYMLTNANTRLLLKSEIEKETRTNQDILELVLDQQFIDTLTTPKTNPPLIGKPDDLAYVIYTSGSTGRPKGVQISHQSKINMAMGLIDLFDITSQDKVLQFAAISFDASVIEIFVALYQGATLVLTDQKVMHDNAAILSYMKSQEVSVVLFTPSYLNTFNINDLTFLRVMVSIGEAANANDMLACSQNMATFNGYGPTECTAITTIHKMDKTKTSEKNIPIGMPIANMSVCLLDENGDITPVGLIGELYIAGIGLAKGYINNEELTEKSFVQIEALGQRFYKSGDLARWDSSGSLVYHGRKDEQLKLRGFRIEPGEIASILREHSAVQDAVVIKGMNDELLAFFVPANNGQDVEKSKELIVLLKECCQQQLPSYMVPNAFKAIEELPTTVNGKADKKVLLDWYQAEILRDSYIAPSNKMEQFVADIWLSVLNKDRISIEDNFFTIGGDSIKGIQIVSRIFKAGYKVELVDLFEYPTLASFAKMVKEDTFFIDQTPVVGAIPNTPIQELFFEKQWLRPNHFNHAVMLHMPEGIEHDTIQAIFTKIQEQHDVLRIQYKKEEGRLKQYNRGADLIPDITQYDLTDWETQKGTNENTASQELEAIANKIQEGIDLEHGRLMKIAHIRMDDGDRILIVIHHLVIDGVSWRILSEDIEMLYQQSLKKQQLTLPSKTHSYQYWAKRLQEYANSPTMLKQIPFWREAASIDWQLTKDHDAENIVDDASKVSFVMDEGKTEQLMTKAHEAFFTQINDLLLTALGIGFYRTFKDDEIVISLEGHGRESILKDVNISRTVGWFTSIYPIKLDYHNDLATMIKEVKEYLRHIPDKGIGYGILKYLTNEENKKELNLEKEASTVVFNYLGEFDKAVEDLSFDIAKESYGKTEYSADLRMNELEFSGMVADKSLMISLTYSQKQFDKDTIDNLMSNYKQALTELIDFCVAQKEAEHTPSDFTYKGLTIEQFHQLSKNYDIKDIYPLSPMQEGMLFQDQYSEESSHYNEQIGYRLQGDLDPLIVEKSLNGLLKRHDVLRTAFVYEIVDKPLQVVVEGKRATFYYEDISHLESEESKNNYVNDFKTQQRQLEFDFTQGELFRVAMLKLDHQVYEFIWGFHHVIMDGWCIMVLITEFMEIYNSYLENRSHRLLPAEPYSTYIKWMGNRDKELSKNYWMQYLSGYDATAFVPKMKVESSKEQDHKNKQYFVKFNIETTQRLTKLTSKHGITLNTIIQVVWGILLSKYNGTQDVVFGTVVSGRPSQISGIEAMVGLFINTVPVRIRYGSEENLSDLLKRAHENAAASEQHHYYPLADIQANTYFKQNLVNHLLTFENYPVSEQIEGIMTESQNEEKGLELEVSQVDFHEQNHYDFNIVFGMADGLILTLDYTDAYDTSYIKGIANHFSNVIDQILENENIKITDIDITTKQEMAVLLGDFAGSKTDYPNQSTLPGLFEAQVKASPNAVAITYEGNSLTYMELNEKSNRLANHLREEYHIEADSLVGLLMERSDWVVISILAILKAGGAYVPIDPSLPKQNILNVLKDTDLDLLLTLSELLFAMDYHSGSLIAVDLQIDTLPERYDNPKVINDPSDLAYVMYTSGSTGVPKGVLVSHRNVIRLVKNTNYINLEPGLKLIPTGAMSFDATTFEFWSMLLNGGQLHILTDKDLKDVSALKSAMLDHDITTMWFTSSWFNQLVDLDLRIFSKLKQLLVGGEKLSPKHINTVREAYPDLTVINGYGPTENTTFSICYPIDADYTAAIPLGTPIANGQVYILDHDLKAVSIGISGGIFLGGDGLSRGYLNQPLLTAERFITNPFVEGEYLYNTGDLGRWMTDGKVEFLGRSDEQLKIRGYRIEPDEIGHVLKQHPAIKDAKVGLVKGEVEDAQLIAAIIPEEKDAYTVKQLATISKMDKTLSTYVLPNQMVMFHNNQSETAFLYEEIFENRTYDKYGVHIKEGDVIFDVGANIGMFSIYVGLHYPNTKMYAFEPLAPTFNTLSANAKLYPIDLRPIHCGLSDEEQKVTFVHYPYNTVMSGKHADDSSVDKDILKGYFNKLQEDYSDKATETQLDEMLEERMITEYHDCTLRRLSDVMREEKVEQIDLLKIDVEKSELEVLLGIDDADWAKVRQVAMELHDIDGKLEKIKTLLTKHGFVYDIEKEDVLEETHLYNIYATKDVGKKTQTATKTLSFNHAGNWTTADALIDDIQRHCEENLPHYMVPMDFRIVPAFPLTQRGKIDTKKLMDSEGYRTRKEVDYEAPRDDIEKQLAQIWQTVLEKENIGLKDNFFELGGHSLKAIQVTSYIAQQMEVKVDLASIFASPTLETLADEIKAGIKVAFSKIAPIPHQAHYDLSHAQLRLFSVCQSEKETVAYNMPGVFVMEGNLNLKAFQEAYRTIVERHESLRTSFIITEDGPKQKIDTVAALDPKVKYTDLRTFDDREEQAKSLNETATATPFDLKQAPLLKLTLLHMESEKYILLFTMHHIISDGRSIAVLINDFLEVYDAYCQKKPNPLQPLQIHYKDFAKWHNDQLKEESLENHRAFWMENLKGPLQPLQLPTDFPRPPRKGNKGKNMRLVLDNQLSDGLQKLALENEGSMFMLFSAAVKALLFYYTKQTDILIGSPILGRDHIDLSNQIGYYLNTLVVRSQFSPEDTFTDLFCRVRENIVNVYKHQNYPFDVLVDDLNLKLDRSRNVLFDVGLTYNVNEEVVLSEEHAFGDIKLSTMTSEFGTSKADIWLQAHVDKDSIWFMIEFNADLFKKRFMEAFVNNYTFLLSTINENPTVGLKQLSQQVGGNEELFHKSKQEASSKSNLDRLLNIDANQL